MPQAPFRTSTMRAIMARYHADMTQQVDYTVADLQQRWQASRAAIAESIAHLTQEMEQAQARGDAITYAWLSQARRLAELKAAVQNNVTQFAAGAQDIIGDAQTAAIDHGTALAQQALAASVPPGVNYTFGVPPEDVLHQLAGAVQPYSPLYGLFEQMGPQAAFQAAQALFTSVSLGEGPRQAAQRLVWATDMSAQRAEVIARTEIMRSWRGAQLANYRANSDVVQQWQWSCDFGPRSCGACIAMDGTLHSLDEELDDHICGRCSALPITRPWSDILAGTGVSDADLARLDAMSAESGAAAERETGAQWFARQDATLQNAILGPAKAEAYRAGDLALADLVGIRHDAQWGTSIEEKSLRSLGMDAQKYLQMARENATASSVVDEVTLAGAVEGTPAQMVDHAAEEEGFALREPPALTREALADKSMPELRQLARGLDVAPARSKAETIDRILAKTQAEAHAATITPGERAALLRAQLDERMAQRELLYGQQSDLVEQRDALLNTQRNAQDVLNRAEIVAKQDLYRASLDRSDPAVKQYLKDAAAYEKNQQVIATARAEQQRLENLMDVLAIQGKQGSAEYAQAKADLNAAVAAETKAAKSTQRLLSNLWEKSSGVYKPELDSLAGFDYRLRQMGINFTPEQIAANRFMVAAREQIAGLNGKIATLDKQLKALDTSLTGINTQIERDLARLRGMGATLDTGADALDTLRPFSDVIELPEGHQPPNALMNKLDYKMREPRDVTKRRIIDDIATRLQKNPDWQEYVARVPAPDNLGQYHWYVDVKANAADTKSAQLVADWIRRWGVGYRPGSPQWVAMQMAVREEFGLDAVIHTAAANAPAGERFYAENGAALRAFMRAMYDNTQQWFADNGISEIEVYRGFGWSAGAEDLVPKGVNWGPAETPNYGVGGLELNPFQSFSADINVSQGTGVGNGFAGAGFGGGNDYSLLIGAKVPVSRVLGTAQTGFGAKLESEIVVMGRATDTVSYRAGTSVESALLQQADEQALSEREVAYSLADGTRARVLANADGTYTVTLDAGAPLTSRWSTKSIGGGLGNVPVKVGVNMKVGSSKTYKTLTGVNKLLRSMRISNEYTPPAVELAVRDDLAAAEAAASATLRAQVERLPADAITSDAQDWLSAQIASAAASATNGGAGASEHVAVDLMSLDAQTARLVANTLGNLLPAMPDVAGGVERVVAETVRSGALAYVSPDGSALVLNAERWSDLASLAERAPAYAQSGWWVAQTPEQIIGHEVGHLVQINTQISNDTWAAALERAATLGGDPLVSQYAGDKIEESFAETFALLVYGQPTAAQTPIAREMATLLRQHGIDYTQLRQAVGSAPLDLSA